MENSAIREMGLQLMKKVRFLNKLKSSISQWYRARPRPVSPVSNLRRDGEIENGVPSWEDAVQRHPRPKNISLAIGLNSR